MKIKNTVINSGSNEDLRVFVCVPEHFFPKSRKLKPKVRVLKFPILLKQVSRKGPN